MESQEDSYELIPLHVLSEAGLRTVPDPPAGNIVLLEQRADANTYPIWSKTQVDTESFPTSLSEIATAPFAARIYLVEGGEETLWKDLQASFLDMPQVFFDCHREDSLLREDPSLDFSKTLFAKWSRPVTQTLENWEIEKKIARGTPWSVELPPLPWIGSPKDPEKQRIDHRRYERCPTHSRQYDPLKFTAERVYHAARECMSLYYKYIESHDENFPKKFIGKALYIYT